MEILLLGLISAIGSLIAINIFTKLDDLSIENEELKKQVTQLEKIINDRLTYLR